MDLSGTKLTYIHKGFFRCLVKWYAGISKGRVLSNGNIPKYVST